LTGALLLTLDISAFQSQIPLQIHANLGGSASPSNADQRNLMLGNFAVEYVPTHFLSVFIDLSGEIRIGNLSTDVKLREDPILLTPGLKITTPAGLYLYLAGDFSLSTKAIGARVNQKPESGGARDYTYSTGVIPAYGAQFVLGWNGFMTIQDDDKDGIRNNIDRCPKDAEDMDNFEDKDGCPDLDNDLDGISDRNDNCPNAPEDKDGFKDEDGCPDLDNDGDSLVDIKDQCPNVAEDLDGFEDIDGCPDLDNDKDGISDSKDKCPNELEDFDGFQDDDGCPDPDNDKDGVIDGIDKCVNESETFNNFQDDDGCPDTIKKESSIPARQILLGIEFRNNGPEMTFNSYQYIEPLIRQLKQSLEVEIEVRGHTDTLGELSKNLLLSQMRAEAVRQYLISKGIDSRRIRAVGLGATDPIADNRTAAGRTKNRRIEVVRIK
jgi:outer membrane protein OmpA-like peptidoglycan-associated protein